MSEFTYSAITKQGQRESGDISAPSLAAAGHMLKERGLLPTSLEQAAEGSILDKLNEIGTVSLSEKIGFIENLGVMLKAGISVTRALQIQVKQSRNARFKKILTDIAQQVESGKSLGEAVGKYPTVFSNIVSSMIKVGEISGNLESSLQYLTIQLRREADLRSKIKGAMIYPSVIVFAMIIIGVLLSIFVLPTLTAVFKDFNGKLPITTQAVIVLSDFMGNHAVVSILIMFAFFASLYGFYKTAAGRRSLDWLLVHFYLINTIDKKINLARFSRILSSLLKSGIPIVQGLEVAGDSMDNVWYRDIVANASIDVKLGKPLTESLSKDPKLFPIIVVQMLQVGEESGTVEEILGQLAEHYEEEVDVTLRNLSSVIEPLLLLVIGGVVGVLAMALIAPIYQISQSIQ